MNMFIGRLDFSVGLLAAIMTWATCALVLGQPTGPVFSDVTEQAGLVYQ